MKADSKAEKETIEDIWVMNFHKIYFSKDLFRYQISKYETYSFEFLR